MEFRLHHSSDTIIAELISDDLVISTTEDALDLMGEAGYLGAESLILRESHLVKEFFDLKSKIAGEILQKFSTYRMKLAITGDFSSFTSKSLQDFIRECNQYGHINFVPASDDAVRVLSTKG